MRFTVYRSGFFRREWRWRLRAANGRIVATGGEGYPHKRDCVDAVNRLRFAAADAPVHTIP